MNAQDLVDKGSANEQMLDFLRACIEARLNIVISGGTGSGKTTFLNILSSYIPDRERIVTIEDAAELCLNQPHVVRLESRPANLEGRGEIKIRDLVRNSLRMRPDRIVVGECRGGEALDMLQAMNTGHDGSLTTAHANSPRDALSRLETMVMMAGFDLPVRAIREQIASAVDLIIQTARLRDGSRKIISISEIVGMEGDVVTMQEIVKYQQHGVDLDNKVAGEFQYTGVQPQCLRRFDEYGITYDVRQLSTLASTGSLW
jgi:pilus assembly protein CpaF